MSVQTEPHKSAPNHASDDLAVDVAGTGRDGVGPMGGNSNTREDSV